MRARFAPVFIFFGIAGITSAVPALADSLALLVTNTAYRDATVGAGPGQNHTLLINAYRAQGFDVIDGRDMKSASLRKLVTRFAEQAGDKDRLIVHFTGRATSLDAQSWLLPLDVPADSLVGLDYGAPSVSTILQLLAKEPGHSALFFADIGGNDTAPFMSGISDVNVPQGVLLLTGPEKPLNDFVVGNLLVKGLPVAQALLDAGDAVRVRGFASPDVGIVPSPPIASADTAPTWVNQVAEQALWAVADKSGRASDFQEYLNRFPNGIFAPAARARLATLVTPPQPKVTPQDVEGALGLSRADKRDIQANLTLLGYDTRGVDGVFGRGSRSAIAAWQSDQAEQPTGYLTRNQISDLAAQTAVRRAANERADQQYWNATGLSGTKDDLQLYLDKYPGGIHASEAKATLAGLIAADRSQADTDAWTQAVGENTADSYRAYLAEFPDGIYASVAEDRVARLDPGYLSPAEKQAALDGEARLHLNTGTRLLIESRLRSLGFNPGKVDGHFKSQTRIAIRNFQTSKGMPATGYMNSATVRALLVG